MRRDLSYIRAESVHANLVIRDADAGAVKFEAAAEGDGGKKLRKFSMTAYTGGRMNVGFSRPVVVDLAGLKVSAKSRPILLGHDPSQIVGHTDTIEINGGTIRASGVVSGAGPSAQEVVASSENGFPWQASIGAAVEKMVSVDAGEKVEVNGRTFTGPLYVARASRLMEISFVALGADDNTTARVAASEGGPTLEIITMTFEQWLKAKGHDLAKLSDAQIATLRAEFDAEQKKAPEGGGTPTAVEAGAKNDGNPVTFDAQAEIARIRAEHARIADVEAVAKDHPEIKAKAVAEGWDKTRTELEVLRAGRRNVPGVIISGQPAATGAVLEAAVCIAAKLSNVEKQFDDKTLEAASKRFRRPIGLQELLLEAAWANGYHGNSFRQDAHGVLRAAFSTFTLPGILSNTANKFLLAGYSYVESVWQQIAAIRPVNDFKTVTSYRLTGAMQFDKVGPDGELKHGSVGEQSFTNKADTYGKMFSITRTDLINDDLGALTEVPRKIGRGAGLKLNDVFWTEFLDNSTFFTANNLNYFEGASSALGIDSLTTAEQKFLDQKDPDGKPVSTRAAILLTPTSLKTTGELLMMGPEVRDTTASTKYVTRNPHAGKWRPLTSAYLNTSSYTGNSSTAWYLLADPNDVPVIEVAFLNGQQTPTVESADADFNTLGIQMRGYFDFGVSKQDFRGGVKSKGAA